MYIANREAKIVPLCEERQLDLTLYRGTQLSFSAVDISTVSEAQRLAIHLTRGAFSYPSFSGSVQALMSTTRTNL